MNNKQLFMYCISRKQNDDLYYTKKYNEYRKTSEKCGKEIQGAEKLFNAVKRGKETTDSKILAKYFELKMELYNNQLSIDKVDEKMLDNLVTWQYNGSKSTIDEFRALSREKQYLVIDFIKDFMIYEELTVNGRDYLLVHGGLGNYYPGKDIEEYSLKELIWDRAEYDIQYFEDTYVVTGHTPTQGILGNPKPGYIYKANHHIAIDCGCNRRDGRLAAVCLDTGQEYYVEKN